MPLVELVPPSNRTMALRELRKLCCQQRVRWLCQWLCHSNPRRRLDRTVPVTDSRLCRYQKKRRQLALPRRTLCCCPCD